MCKITDNFGLIGSIIKDMKIKILEYDDLFDIGVIGLIKADRSYDENKGIKFSTYATNCIKNEIITVLNEENKHLNVLSLNATIDDDDTITLSDIIPDNDGINIYGLGLRANIDKLNDLERYCLISYYGLYEHIKITQIDIAEKLNKSNTYVNRIIKRAINKLSKSMQ